MKPSTSLMLNGATCIVSGVSMGLACVTIARSAEGVLAVVAAVLCVGSIAFGGLLLWAGGYVRREES